jgi:hypothetical protein
MRWITLFGIDDPACVPGRHIAIDDDRRNRHG